jgi:hypothetical protein
LVRADPVEFSWSVGSQREQGDPGIGGLDHGGVQIGGSGAGCGDDTSWPVRMSQGQPKGHKSGRTLVNAHPNTQVTALARGFGGVDERSRPRSRRDHQIPHARRDQPLKKRARRLERPRLSTHPGLPKPKRRGALEVWATSTPKSTLPTDLE